MLIGLSVGPLGGLTLRVLEKPLTVTVTATVDNNGILLIVLTLLTIVTSVIVMIVTLVAVLHNHTGHIFIT